MTRNVPLFGASESGRASDTPMATSSADQPHDQLPLPSTPDDASPASYTAPFLSFLAENPTVFHTVSYYASRLRSYGFKQLSERCPWDGLVQEEGKYFVVRNGSSLIAFVVGSHFYAGSGAAIIAGHIDALTAKLKPIPTLPTKAGFVQLGVAPYAGALNKTWWDRDLGIGGRVLIRDQKLGKVVTKLVKLGWPIAHIPTLAPHFGAAANGPFNKETEMVPIIGLDNSECEDDAATAKQDWTKLCGEGTFAATQPERLVRIIAKELGVHDYADIVNWELELYDIQPAQLGGLDKEFIFAGRIDDKLCSFAALEALIAASCPAGNNEHRSPNRSSILKVAAVFDDEEIGSLLRQGARSNFLTSVLERVVECFTDMDVPYGADVISQTFANSFLVSADVTHAVNPNFLNVYLKNHAPRLNVGVAVSADPNGHMTTDAASTAILQRVAQKCGSTLQVFQIRNDSRSGGTVGPMLSSRSGIRAIDAGIPQLAMHSIRATTGSLDPGLGVKMFKGFFDHFEEVDAEFCD